MRFSEKYGYKKVREIVQVNSVDEQLRNGLWSLLKVHAWDHVKHANAIYGDPFLSSDQDMKDLCQKLWFSYFKKPLDTLVDDWSEVLASLRAYFFDCPWYEVYDFIEFVANNYDRYEFRDRFLQSCNAVLQKEVSAYRFVNGVIAPITEQQEIEEIELALERARGPVPTHLRRALELLSDREAPDYRNSIKESISAVESLVAKTFGVEKGTLGQLIKKLEDEINLHPALGTAFSKLYGYTSEEGGIRHAILESENVVFEDAKFFLVVCSAFVNYVESRISSAG